MLLEDIRRNVSLKTRNKINKVRIVISNRELGSVRAGRKDCFKESKKRMKKEWKEDEKEWKKKDENDEKGFRNYGLISWIENDEIHLSVDAYTLLHNMSYVCTRICSHKAGIVNLENNSESRFNWL